MSVTPERGEFPDLSIAQGVVDFGLLYEQAEVREVVVRGGEGYVGDGYAPRYVKDALAKGITVHLYWAFYPWLYWDVQARAFIAYLYGLDIPGNGAVPTTVNGAAVRAWSDMESYGALLYGEIARRSALHLEMVRGVYPIGIYSRADYLDRVFGAPEWLHHYPLWVAHWPLQYGTPRGVTPPLMPKAYKQFGTPWSIWQRSSQGRFPGINARVDINRRP